MPGKPHKVAGSVVNAGGAIARRLTTPVRRYQTGGPLRPRIPGPVTRVSAISEQQVVDGVQDVVRRQLRNIRVFAAGALTPAHRVFAGLERPDEFFAAGVQTLFDHAGTFGLSATETRRLVLGNDTFTRQDYMISVEERIRRVVEAQLAAAAELLANNIDTLDPRGVNRLYTYLTPTMIEFTRGFVNRYGYEHGLRFELRLTDLMENLEYLSGLPPVHQARAPFILGNRMGASSDTLLFGLDYAIGTQYKAFSFLDALAVGSISFGRDSSGLVRKVYGPAMVKQALSDALRWHRYGYWVPGPRAARWNSVLPPANPAGAGWRPLGETTLFICDIQLVGNQLLEVVDEAFRRTGAAQINLTTDLHTTPERAAVVLEVFRSSQGTVLRRDMPELDKWRAIEEYSDRRLVALQDLGNEELARPDVLLETGGREVEILLVGSHQESRLAEVLRTHEVIP